jgi:hypothetical protein
LKIHSLFTVPLFLMIALAAYGIDDDVKDEWETIKTDYPLFAGAYMSQQALLIGVSARNEAFIRADKEFKISSEVCSLTLNELLVFHILGFTEGFCKPDCKETIPKNPQVCLVRFEECLTAVGTGGRFGLPPEIEAGICAEEFDKCMQDSLTPECPVFSLENDIRGNFNANSSTSFESEWGQIQDRHSEFSRTYTNQQTLLVVEASEYINVTAADGGQEYCLDRTSEDSTTSAIGALLNYDCICTQNNTLDIIGCPDELVDCLSRQENKRTSEISLEEDCSNWYNCLFEDQFGVQKKRPLLRGRCFGKPVGLVSVNPQGKLATTWASIKNDR